MKYTVTHTMSLLLAVGVAAAWALPPAVEFDEQPFERRTNTVGQDETPMVEIPGDDDNAGEADSGSLRDTGGASGAPGTPAFLVGFLFNFGTHLSGDLVSLDSIDGDQVVGRSVFGFSAREPNILELEVIAVNDAIPEPTSMDVTIAANLNNPGGIATLSMMNWSTFDFDAIGSWSIGIPPSVQSFKDVDAKTYITEAGATEILARVRTSVVATFSAQGFDGFFDQLRFVVR